MITLIKQRIKILLAYFVFSFSNQLVNAQISEQQALPIDSLLAHTYLTSPNLHSGNIHSTNNGSVMVWDAVNGRYNNLIIAYSFTSRVEQEIAEAINSVNGKEYKLFDLDSFGNPDQYMQAVENWLSSLGLPVYVQEFKDSISIKNFPNPTSGLVNIELFF